MKKFLFVFYVIFSVSSNFSTHAIDLPKYYKFPKNYLKGKFYDSSKDFFLVSTKKTGDLRFINTVIIILEHDKDGALGIVINKPLGKFKLGDLISNTKDKKINKKELYDVNIPIYWGGPLDNDKILILHSNDYKNNTTKIFKQISISKGYKTLIDIAEKKGPKDNIVILGVAAWNANQLDGEIEMEKWTISEINTDLIFNTDNNSKWSKAFKNSFIRL